VQGREKVYIIDEAQRLSAPAFDALLKVFEEPPVGVRFVLATTEPHKMPATIVGRCQRFDFRRHTVELLSEHLQKVAAAEGVKLLPSAAHTIARQAEGSARDALSLLDQASLMGGAEIDDEVIGALLGVPRAEVQHEIADAVAVGDVRATFEIVNRLVQDGQDLRNVTAETLAHFRNLLLVKTAPGQEDLLDVSADAYEHLRAQAAKFNPAELARVLALLLAAQSDMRWTTSPRLSFELALVRATMPETDPQPAGVVARLERLERLANLDVSATSSPAVAEVEAEPSAVREAPAASQAPKDELIGVPEVQPPMPVAADAGNVDTTMLRRGWQTLLDHLQSIRQPILKALLESATVATFDGETIELAFPPDKRFAVQKIEAKADELRGVLNDVFGVRPQIRCVVRESTVGPIVEEEEVPDEAEALRRIQEMLGAEVAADPEAETE
jgi:DNA polymerase-3 subunit gamma/tau